MGERDSLCAVQQCLQFRLSLKDVGYRTSRLFDRLKLNVSDGEIGEIDIRRYIGFVRSHPSHTIPYFIVAIS